VKENRWLLVGTAGCWFILDVVFYANSLFSGQITDAMGLGDTIKEESLAQLILQVIIVTIVLLKLLKFSHFLSTNLSEIILL
jgi:hypothetical protein